MTCIYNSVRSIKLHRHKFYPDTLELELVNISGNLDQAENNVAFRMQGEMQRLAAESNVPGVFTPNNNNTDAIRQIRSELKNLLQPSLRDPVTGRRAELDSLFLREGTMVVVKMGYTNKPKEMETVFTGQIAEIVRGDIIHLVAQNYANELTVPVNKKESKSPLEAVASVMEDEAPVHFGVLRANLPEYQFERDARAAKFRGLDENSPVIRTRRLDNCFLTSSGHNWKWRIPNKVGLEVLDEIVRHFPGMVFGVRPYENNATLFMGYPSQPYRITDEGLNSELRRIPRARRWERGLYTLPDTRDIDDRRVAAATAAVLMATFAGRAGGPQTQEFQDWKDGIGNQVYPEAPLELSLARYRYYNDSFFEFGINTRDKTDRRNLLDKLVSLVGPDAAREVIRFFFNDMHRLSTNTVVRWDPIMIYRDDGESGWVLLGNVAREFGRLGETVELGAEALGAIVDTILSDKAIDIFKLGPGLDGNKILAMPDGFNRVRGLLAPFDDVSKEDIAKDVLRRDDGASSVDGFAIEEWADTADRYLQKLWLSEAS